jgi:ATP-dependent helicase/nuclease subunit B
MSERASSRLYNIPAGASFVDALAAGLIEETRSDPTALAHYRILLPTRRGCRSLREAFLRQSEGTAMVLPRLTPLGDIDEEELSVFGGLEAGPEAAALAPPIAPMRRQALLTSLVRAYYARLEGLPPSLDQAALLAAELARLLDQVETERLSFDRLQDLVADRRFSDHWQKILDFLAIVTRNWPGVLADQNALDPADRRNRLIDAQRAHWERNPTDHPVIVAGSTGSVPATADLIATVAGLKQGRIVLAGLDRDADETTWKAIAGDPAHPQHGLALLLAKLEARPRDVTEWRWPGEHTDKQGSRRAATRARILAEAMRPAATAERWQEARQHFDAATIDNERLLIALDGLKRIDCPTPAEEAATIALLMRGALEAPGKRAALVTADRDLARRVAAALKRWDIAVDDSAGVPLAETPPGSLLQLLAEAVAADFAPVPLLALLKHPLAAGGTSPSAFREQARALERAVLRGPRPAPGFAGLRAALSIVDVSLRGPLEEFVSRIEIHISPLLHAVDRDLVAMVDAHIESAERLATTDAAAGAVRLWAGEAGEAAALFIDALREAAPQFPAPGFAEYPPLFAALMRGQVVRPGWGRHPRLAIWGPLEARLQQVETMILGGLNEGSWPPEMPSDAWFSRPMRAAFGLPPPERRIGLSAHDFTQACTAPEVYLTRSLRVAGTPTVPARWLLRLDALLVACNVPTASIRDDRWLGHALALDRPRDDEIRPCDPPAPKPPVAARPTRLSVTEIGTWMSDPYALYAKKILNLKELDPIDEAPGAADRGNFVHDALDRFVKAHPDTLPANARDVLVGLGETAYKSVLDRPELRAFWWPRFERIVDWFLAEEAQRRPLMAVLLSEIRATWQVPDLDFTLVAKIDRVEQRQDGSLVIADYKTGSVPTRNSVEFGYAPQLTLEAAMARAGALPGIAHGAARELSLEYWRLTGNQIAGAVIGIAGEADALRLALEAEQGLRRLVQSFQKQKTPYPSRPHPLYAPHFSAYDHLARVAEWSSSGSERG